MWSYDVTNHNVHALKSGQLPALGIGIETSKQNTSYKIATDASLQCFSI